VVSSGEVAAFVAERLGDPGKESGDLSSLAEELANYAMALGCQAPSLSVCIVLLNMP